MNARDAISIWEEIAMANRLALLLSVGSAISLHIRWPAQPPPRPPTRCEPPTLGAGKKTSFEEYTISGEGSHIFPLPAERAAVKAAKKFRGKGAPAAKAPPGALETVLPGLDRSYPGLRVHHLDPLVLVADGFLSDDECDAYRALAGGESAHELSQSATFSSLTASGRTSTTWYVTYAAAHPLLARAAALTGHPLDNCEEPQLVRYRPGESFSWHYDAVPPTMLANGGQRLATLLVYLNDVPNGGRTAFRDLRAGSERLGVAPRKGRALLFFPSADADGTPDERTLHAGEPAPPDSGEKWIAQIWLHERPYDPALPPGNSHADATPLVREYAAEHALRLDE